MLVVLGLVLAVIKALGETVAVEAVQTLLEFLLRIGIIAAVLYPFYMLGVLGAGDVKLCCMCTAFLKGADCPGVFFVSFLLAAVIGFGKLLFLGNIRERMFYFLSYAADVVRLGRLKPYWTEENSHLKADASLRMAGPLLLGVLLHVCSKV